MSTTNPLDGFRARVQQNARHALDAAATAEMDTIRRSSPSPRPKPIHWSLNEVDGTIRGYAAVEYADSEVPAVLRRWADILGLAPVTPVMRGITEYGGTIDGCPVRIWGVTDRDAFGND